MEYLRFNNFPDCCGMKVLSFFGGSTTNYATREKLTHNEISNDLDKAREWGLGKEYNFFVALAEEQLDHVEPVLKAHGFQKIISNLYNPGHKSRLTLYMCPTPNDKEFKLGGEMNGTYERSSNEAPRKKEAEPLDWISSTEVFGDSYARQPRNPITSPQRRAITRTTVTDIPARKSVTVGTTKRVRG